MISLYKIKIALGQLGADSQKIDDATTKLTELLADLDELAQTASNTMFVTQRRGSAFRRQTPTSRVCAMT